MSDAGRPPDSDPQPSPDSAARPPDSQARPPDSPARPPESPRAPEPPRATEAYGSIIERFRGTEWDTGSNREPTPAPKGPSLPILLVGVVTLVLVGSVTLVSVLGRPAPATPPPSHVIVTPGPTPGPDAILLDAFWAEIQRPAFSYHLAVAASLSDRTEKAIESMTIDVHGEDYAGLVDVEVKPGLAKTRWVILRSGGVLYIKRPGARDWGTAITAGQVDLRPRPFLSLDDRRELIVSGTAVRDGVTYRRLVSTDAYRPPLTRVLPFSLGTLPTTHADLEILVTDAGVPVEAMLTLHVPADPANGFPALDGTATYTFIKVDAVDPIASPKL